MKHIQYRYAMGASLIWLLDAVMVVRDQLATGTADWVPFLAFTGLMLLLAVPILLEK